MVEFHAPWCSECQTFDPEYAKAAKILANEGSPIVLAKVDCVVETSLARKYGIRSYPTLKFFKRDPISGVPIVMTYKGAHNADAILSFVESYKPDPPKIHSHTLRDGPGKKRTIFQQC